MWLRKTQCTNRAHTTTHSNSEKERQRRLKQEASRAAVHRTLLSKEQGRRKLEKILVRSAIPTSYTALRATHETTQETLQAIGYAGKRTAVLRGGRGLVQVESVQDAGPCVLGMCTTHVPG